MIINNNNNSFLLRGSALMSTIIFSLTFDLFDIKSNTSHRKKIKHISMQILTQLISLLV